MTINPTHSLSRFWLRPDRYRDGERGIALVVVLWIVTSLSVLILAHNASLRSHLDLTRSEFGLARSHAVLEAAVRLAVLKLREDNPKYRWPSDNRAQNVNVVGHDVRIVIQDERGLIDVNAASQQLLEGILAQHIKQPGRARSLSARIVQSRMNLPGATKRTFADTIELTSYLSIPEQIAAPWLANLTVFNGRATVNIMSAPRAVIAGLPDIDAGTVSRIIEERNRGTETDSKALLASLGRWQPYLASESGPAYRLRIDITDRAATPAAAQVSVLLPADGKTAFHILEWREVRQRLQ